MPNFRDEPEEKREKPEKVKKPNDNFIPPKKRAKFLNKFKMNYL